MGDSAADVAAAKRAIRAMLREAPRPTQKMIALATGMSQGYVAKINKCAFSRVSRGIMKVVEYSKMSTRERVDAGTRSSGVALRIGSGVERLAARDPALAEALADFIEKVVNRAAD